MRARFLLLVGLVTAARAEEKEADTVVVGGTRASRAGGSAHVVGKDQLERFRYDNPEKVVTQVPGVYARGEDGWGLRPNIAMRGTNPDRSKKVTLMEDGVLFGPAPYSAPAAYYFPLVGRMQSVRVFKGPGAIVYGPQTVAGAIDFITRDIPEGFHASADMGFGLYGYRKAHVVASGATDRWGFLVEAMNLGTSGFKEIDTRPNADTGFVRNELMIKGRYVPDPEDPAMHQLDAKIGYSDESSNETYLGLSDDDFRNAPLRRYQATTLDHMRWHRTQLVFSHRFRPVRNLEIKTTIYRHDLHRIWRKVNGFEGVALETVLDDPTSARNRVFYEVLTGKQDSFGTSTLLLIGPNDRTFVSQGAQTVANLTTKTGPIAHKMEYGLRLHYDEIVRKHTQDQFALIGGSPVPVGSPTQLTADNTASTIAVAFHAVDAMSWGRFALSPGLRIESVSGRYVDRLTQQGWNTNNVAILPGVGAYVETIKNLGLLAGIHRGFSPPIPDTRSARPEESINVEAGARYDGKLGRLELIGYLNEYSNITTVCTASSGCLSSNLDRQLDGGAARIWGLEAFGRTAPKVGSFSFPLRVGYTLTIGEFLSDFSSADPVWGNVKAGDEIPYLPISQITSSAGIETKTWGLNAGGTYVGDMREKPGQGIVEQRDLTDAYFDLDASAFFKVGSHVTFYVNGRNLLNQAAIVGRRPFGARPLAPIGVQAGVTLHL